MSIIFALRSDNANFTARYSKGLREGRPMAQTSANLPAYITDAGAIGGNSFDLALSAAANRCIAYSGRGVFGSVTAISVLMRIKFTAVGTYGLFEFSGAPFTTTPNLLNMFMVSDWRCTVVNQDPTLCTSGVLYGTPPSTGTWYDVVFTWDGTTTSNAVKLWIDGTNVGSRTAGAAATSGRNEANTVNIIIGGLNGATSTRYLINEFVIWDEVIDPTSVTLTSGSGSLNGASRTAFVDAADFSAVEYSDPTEANVKTGTAYTYAGVDKTGTYTGSDRWSDPGASNVSIGVQYKADSTTNNRTGSLDVGGAVWDALTTNHADAGSFGALMQKLLTVAKFLGLK